MNDIAEWVNFFTEQWHKRTTILILLLTILIVLVYLATNVKLSEIERPWYFLIPIVLTITFVVWKITTNTPKVKKGKVGLLIAITLENPKSKNKIKLDFTHTLSELLQHGNLRYQFKLIELNDYHSLKITNAETANYYLKKSKCHFLLYGVAKERTIKGSLHHVINLNGIVSHKPISKETSKEFSKEFNELLPRKMTVSFEGDVFAFEFTAQLIDIVARYIIGIASLLSYDLEYARDLFEDLQKKILSIETKLPVVTKIKARLPSRLITTYVEQIQLIYDLWIKTHDKRELQKMEPILSKLLSIDAKNYNGNLLSAICHFSLNRDIASAKKNIRNCRKTKDGTWRYSEAFLYAYEGNMKNAKRKYFEAFRSSNNDITVPIQIEEFILDILDEEQDKIQLYFCLGLINYHSKQDREAAKRDFTQFISICNNSLFQEELEEAYSYVEKINQELNSLANI
ncbi:MAG: hypothetical protein AAB071_03035 [Bacteroidota bacterium]